MLDGSRVAAEHLLEHVVVSGHEQDAHTLGSHRGTSVLRQVEHLNLGGVRLFLERLRDLEPDVQAVEVGDRGPGLVVVVHRLRQDDARATHRRMRRRHSVASSSAGT